MRAADIRYMNPLHHSSSLAFLSYSEEAAPRAQARWFNEIPNTFYLIYLETHIISFSSSNLCGGAHQYNKGRATRTISKTRLLSKVLKEPLLLLTFRILCYGSYRKKELLTSAGSFFLLSGSLNHLSAAGRD